jgi:DNA-binding transcriptional LysR family regulator
MLLHGSEELRDAVGIRILLSGSFRETMEALMRDRLDGVAVFVETVEAGSFARAAERLALTRSAVGKAVARLEARLGARLFNRTTRSQKLTEEGQIFYERCLRALDELRAGQASIESCRQEVVGRLRVSMPVLYGRYCVAPLLLELAAQHPRLELMLSFNDDKVDMIADGFDLAVRNGSPGPASGLRGRKLVSHTKLLCASPAYLDAHGSPTDLETVSRHEALVYRRKDTVLPWLIADSTGRIHDLALNSRLGFDDLEALADAAVAGLGIAWLPRWLVHTRLREGTLVALLEDLPPISMDCFAVWPDTEFIPLRLRMAIDLLANRLGALEGRLQA